MRRGKAAAAIGFAAAMAMTVAACGGSDGGRAVALAGGAPAVEATGRVIEVRMMSVNGERFGPAELVAARGDVVRFVLESGVHNVSFPADLNVAGVKLPETSPYLQVPGQTHDVLIDLPPGEYAFHCDPHAALGMVGKLTVTD